MATIAHTIEEIQSRGDNVHMVTWTPLAAGDVGQSISLVGANRRTAHVIGALSNMAKVVIEGSNDNVNFTTLTDEHGNALDFRAAAIATISELTRHIRPRVSLGNPGATVMILFRREARS